MITPSDPAKAASQQGLYRSALWLAIFTVAYNLIEGIVSVSFGAHDEGLTLFGFGIDSFIEVISGIGILAMVVRIRRSPGTPRAAFERSALRVTGWSFYILAGGLLITALYNLSAGHKPAATLSGAVISIISIAVMWALVAAKRRVGRALDSAPILADANCTLVCVYMSVVLLGASLVYATTGFGAADSLGALGLIYFSAGEGREALEKSAGLEDPDAEDEGQA